jgi:1,4-dihydroxy-2-naphthoate octaprenyltransferase
VSAQTALLEGLEDRYTHAVVAFIGGDGYPMSVATGFRSDPARGLVILDGVAGDLVAPPEDRQVNVVFSHIRPQPGQGYDERRYVSFWGILRPAEGRYELMPERVQHWDEQEMAFFEFSERGVPQAHRYMEQLSETLGRPVKPRLSPFWLLLRATRLPFLSATFVPVGVGIAVAGLHGQWHWWLAILTLVAGACVHLGLNVANDVFDTDSGADPANVNPTQFSGGSRVIYYGLMSRRQMQVMSIAFYAGGLGIGLYLAIARAFWPIVIIGALGALISYFYTAPPLRLVHRGLGEIGVFLGFGPIMALGAYYVQAQRFSWEAVFASLPVGILVALILYVNEVPDRPADASVGKRTLPVRWGREAVIAFYAAAVATAFLLIAVGSIAGPLPFPAIVAMAGAPLAAPVYRELQRFYESPYQLMPAMAKNIQLHVVTGMLLIAGYVIAIVASHLSHNPPFFLR